jgi:hypothetical protein
MAGFGSMRDCPTWHGWFVGVPIDAPASATAWAAATTAGTFGGAIWGVGGIASDGTNPFATTGNTRNTGGVWGDGEAVIRFQPGPIFSGWPADYWVPMNLFDLDGFDGDLGASGPLLVDVPGATPSHLIVAMGKDRKAYLINRDNLGGISDPIDEAQVASSTILQAAVTLSDREEHLCRVPRQQRRQHCPLRFPHYCGQPTCHRHRQRLEREPGQRWYRLAFCDLY